MKRSNIQLGLTTAALALATPVMALASEEGGEVSVFAGDIGTALWTVVIFLGVVFVLGRFAWPTILKGFACPPPSWAMARLRWNCTVAGLLGQSNVDAIWCRSSSHSLRDVRV